MKIILKYLISLAIILGALAIGNTIQSMLALSIPGSILGMLLLFGGMLSGLIPSEWVKPSASIFIRYMVLLFIPISAGLIDHYPMLLDNALPILASTIGATAIVIVFLSWMLEKILVGKK